MRSVKEWNLVDVERQCLDATLIVSFWILRYNSTAICSVLCRYRCFCDAVSMWFTVLCLENRKCENCRIRGTNLSRQVAVANSFVRWHLISVVSECWTCFMCPFWSLEFWGVTFIFLEIVYLCTSVRKPTSFSALTQPLSYRCSMHDLWHCKPVQLRFLVGILQQLYQPFHIRLLIQRAAPCFPRHSVL